MSKLDLDELTELWKEEPMTELQLDTARISGKNELTMKFFWGSIAVLALTTAWAAVRLVLEPSIIVASGLALLCAIGVTSVVFGRSQSRSLRESQALLLGSPVELVSGRMKMLEMEVTAWVGGAAKVSLFLGFLGCVFALRSDPVLGLSLFVGWVGMLVYGWGFRMPALRAELADLKSVLDDLTS